MKGILLDKNGELSVKNGKLEIGDTDYQNIDLIMYADKGDFKERPLKGVGMEKYLKSTNKTDELKREIMVQLEAEGYKSPKVELTPTGELSIEI